MSTAALVVGGLLSVSALCSIASSLAGIRRSLLTLAEIEQAREERDLNVEKRWAQEGASIPEPGSPS